MKIIELHKVNYSVKDKHILKDISFFIEKGAYVSILGMNGSGKSTLALAISNLIKIDSGTVNIKDDLKVGIVLENPDSQIVGTTVEEDIAFGLQNLQLTREQINERIDFILKDLDIEHLKYKEVIELSGGQKQKLAIASLLAMGYEIYILDEVTSMLDPESKEIVFQLIDKLVKSGKTVIQITHFMEEAKRSKTSIVLNNGKVNYFGLTNQLMNDEESLKKNNLIEVW